MSNAVPYLPPEWARQSGVMLTWPHPQSDWAALLELVEPVFIELVCHISSRERVLIVCYDSQHKSHVCARLQAAGVASDRLDIDIYIVSSNDAWARDHGPITVEINGSTRLLDFRFNGWGGKYAAEMDNTITTRLHRAGAFGNTELEEIDMVLEGGSIDVDGKGTVLTTERCLLSRTRNPGLERAQIEDRVQHLLGVDRILWLRHGSIPGDDTDGHIDTLARFCDAKTIAYVAPHKEAGNPMNELQAMERELMEFRTAEGEPYDLIPLPHPIPICNDAGRHLPASYANFLIINGAVLVPTYGDPADEKALTCLRACFDTREIIPIDARPLIQQYGSIHCVAMQFPEGVLTER